MKKYVLSVTLASAGCLMADEPPQFCAPQLTVANPHHQVFPRLFFRKHREGGYKYDMFGLGVGYQYKKEQGVNVKCAISTNLDGDKPYIENETSLAYSIPYNDLFAFAPYIGSKHATHQINKVDDMKYVITKGSLYSGIGLKHSAIQNLETEFRIGLSRDLYNVLLHSSDDKFVGRKFSNPFGFIGELVLNYKFFDIVEIALDGSFARGFKGEFKNFGGGLAANWRF